MVSILNSFETGPSDNILDAQIDYYGLQLATSSFEGLIKIFDLKKQSLIVELNGHTGPVWQISWAHPKYGMLLASCSFDRRVILWKEDRGWTKVNEFLLDSPVTCVQFAPHQYGLIFACGSTDGNITIFTYENGNWEQKILQGHLLGCNSISWAPPNGEMCLVSGGCDNLLKISEYNPASSVWEEKAVVDIHNDWIKDVAWGPSTTVDTIVSCSKDRTVIVNSSVDRKNWNSKLIQVFDNEVCGVTWNQNIVAVTLGNKKVSLWKESEQGQWICIKETPGFPSDSNIHS